MKLISERVGQRLLTIPYNQIAAMEYSRAFSLFELYAYTARQSIIYFLFHFAVYMYKERCIRSFCSSDAEKKFWSHIII